MSTTLNGDEMANQGSVREECIHICLTGSSEDSVISDPAYQQELRNFSSSLREVGIKFSQRSMVFDSAQSVGFPLGEYLISFAGVACPIIGVAIGAWIQGRAGRKVKLKIGDIEIEASSQKEVEVLLKKALKIKNKEA